MNIILFDGPEWSDLLPLTYTRAVAELRVGIDTIHQKWESYLNTKCFIRSQPYLNYSIPNFDTPDFILINSSFIPDNFLTDTILALQMNQKLVINDQLIAFRTNNHFLSHLETSHLDPVSIQTNKPILHIGFPWHIFTLNDLVLRQDFERITRGKTSSPISDGNRLIGDQIFAEEGVKVEAAIINSTYGPVYLSKESEIMEGAIIRGGLALGEGSSIKMGAKLYGANTIGPHCKIGGEVTNSVFQGYSNKGHDGFLGNSVIGQWCNFGADTNSSNLKNNYKKVRIYNYTQGSMIDTGQQFIGLIMGDHSKTGINTMLNTGTVVGVSSNIFGAGFPPTHIPSFTWCNQGEMEVYRLEKAIEVATAVMARRQLSPTQSEIKALTHIYNNTHPHSV